MRAVVTKLHNVLSCRGLVVDTLLASKCNRADLPGGSRSVSQHPDARDSHSIFPSISSITRAEPSAALARECGCNEVLRERLHHMLELRRCAEVIGVDSSP